MRKIFKKTKKPVFSHDRFFKAFFSNPKLAKELLLLAFTKTELKVFDLSKIKTEKDTFEGRGADIILSVPFKNHPRKSLRIFILLEHKSQYDRYIFEQSLDYQVLLRKHIIKQRGQAQPITPLLFYHGKQLIRWKKSLQEEDFKDFFSKIPVGIRKSMLNYELKIIDTKDSEIRKIFKDKKYKVWGIIKLLDEVWNIKEPSSEKVKSIVRDYFGNILKGKKKGEVNEIVFGIVEYLRDTAGLKWKEWQKAEQELIEEGILKKGGIMNVREVVREKGRWEGERKGLRKGRQEGRQEVVLNMLKEKMNISVISKVTGFSTEEIKRLKNGA